MSRVTRHRREVERAGDRGTGGLVAAVSVALVCAASTVLAGCGGRHTAWGDGDLDPSGDGDADIDVERDGDEEAPDTDLDRDGPDGDADVPQDDTWALSWHLEGEDWRPGLILDVAATTDGGAVVVGQAGLAWAARLDATGTEVWSRLMTSATAVGTAHLQAVAVAPDGRIYVAGEAGLPDRSTWLAELDPTDGSTMWQASVPLYPLLVRLATLEGGDVIIIGPLGMSSAVARVASGGEVVWSRQVSGDPVGLWALAVSADDRIVVSFGPDTDASSLLVLDAEGEVLAAMTPKVGRSRVEVLTLAATAEGGVVMAGGGRGGVGGLLVARLGPDLEPEWAFAAGRLPDDEEMPMVCAGPWPACADSVLDVAVAADGSVMAVGLGFYSSEVVGIAVLADAEGVYQRAAGVELAPTLSNTIGFAVAASSGGGWAAGFSTGAADSLLASLDAEGRLGSACEPFVDQWYTPREVSLTMEPYEVTLEAVDLELGPADVEDDDWPVSVERVCE